MTALISAMQPVTYYANSGNVHIAYQVFGEGPVNVVLAPPFISNVEHWWDEPDVARWLLRLASYARVVMFDKRGTGMSDRIAELPGLDERMDRPAISDGRRRHGTGRAARHFGRRPLTVLFAATYPDRCRSLVLYGSFAHFTSWFVTEEALKEFFKYVDQAWGSGGSLRKFAPSRANDPAFQSWWGKGERHGAGLYQSYFDLGFNLSKSLCSGTSVSASSFALDLKSEAKMWRISGSVDRSSGGRITLPHV